jgi:hypothetical protein
MRGSQTSSAQQFESDPGAWSQVRAFREQLAAQHKWAADKSEQAMARVVQGAARTASALEAEALDLRRKRPAKLVKGGKAEKRRKEKGAADARSLAEHEAAGSGRHCSPSHTMPFISRN